MLLVGHEDMTIYFLHFQSLTPTPEHLVNEESEDEYDENERHEDVDAYDMREKLKELCGQCKFRGPWKFMFRGPC